jgi:hypothetical protein
MLNSKGELMDMLELRWEWGGWEGARQGRGGSPLVSDKPTRGVVQQLPQRDNSLFDPMVDTLFSGASSPAAVAKERSISAL